MSLMSLMTVKLKVTLLSSRVEIYFIGDIYDISDIWFYIGDISHLYRKVFFGNMDRKGFSY